MDKLYEISEKLCSLLNTFARESAKDCMKTTKCSVNDFAKAIGGEIDEDYVRYILENKDSVMSLELFSRIMVATGRMDFIIGIADEIGEIEEEPEDLRRPVLEFDFSEEPCTFKFDDDDAKQVQEPANDSDVSEIGEEPMNMDSVTKSLLDAIIDEAQKNPSFRKFVHKLCEE